MRPFNISLYFVMLLLVVAGFMTGCATVSEKPANVPYHTLYQVIDDPEAIAFLEDGIQFLHEQPGSFEFPIVDVYLRHSQKNEWGQQYAIAQGFSKTEIVNREQGICVIYIAVPPSDPEFYLLLAHEIGHLQQPSVTDDWAMEGFCMVFSEKLCNALGRDWSLWKTRFTRRSKDPYAVAYWQALGQ